MNRYLLAGCAAAALALGAGAANAQAKFEVKVGGDAYFEAGYVDQDLNTGLRSTEFQNRFRVNIIPTAKADNGLEYGGRVRIRAAGTNTGVSGDRAYIFAQGTFGQVRLGVTNSFNDETYTTAPMDYLPLSLFDRVVNWIGASQSNYPQQAVVNGRYSGADVNGGVVMGINGGDSIVWPSLTPEGNGTKIVYFSPRFAGLQLGASYTPRNDSVNQDVNRVKLGTATSGFTSTWQDLVEVGANYSNTFGGFKVQGSAGYFWGDAVGTTTASVPVQSYRDLNAWQVGAQVGYAGFAVGGSYTDFGKSGQNRISGQFGERTYNWVAGVQYTTGPIVVGANYKYGVDPGDMALPGSRRLSVIEVGAGYTVAPGLTLQAQYDYFDANSDKTPTATLGSPDDKGSVFLVRSVLAF
ncbi:porin [Azospirillum sp. sgz302134]